MHAICKFIYTYSRVSLILDKFDKKRYKFIFMEDIKKDLSDRFALSSTLHSSIRNVISIQTTTLLIKVFFNKMAVHQAF